jgi:hypothetical protein
MAVLDNKHLIAGGCDLISSRIGARPLSNCFCFLLLFDAAASVVAAGGGCFKADFKADLAFQLRCVGVMAAWPLLSLEAMKLDVGKRTINKKEKHR